MLRFLVPVRTLACRTLPLTALAAQSCAVTGFKTSYEVPKVHVNAAAKENVAKDDDERWLEAELDENILSPEEVFAKQREQELLRKMAKLKVQNWEQ